MCSEVSVNSPGNLWSQSGRRNGRLRWEGFAEKEGFQAWNESVGDDGILIVISIHVSSITTVNELPFGIRMREEPLISWSSNFSRWRGKFSGTSPHPLCDIWNISSTNNILNLTR